MPPTTSYDFGELVLIPFPYTDQTGSKKRPAIVVSSPAFNRRRPDLILVPVTSQQHVRPVFGEVALDDWQVAGLLAPSATKPIIITLEKSLVVKKLGRLSAGDCAAVKDSLLLLLG